MWQNHALCCALATLGYQMTYVQDIPDALLKRFGSASTEAAGNVV